MTRDAFEDHDGLLAFLGYIDLALGFIDGWVVYRSLPLTLLVRNGYVGN
jgi:hypothetical protein